MRPLSVNKFVLYVKEYLGTKGSKVKLNWQKKRNVLNYIPENVFTLWNRIATKKNMTKSKNAFACGINVDNVQLNGGLLRLEAAGYFNTMHNVWEICYNLKVYNTDLHDFCNASF